MSETYSLPYVIGVTGHRDLIEEDIQGLEYQVGELIGSFRKKCPKTPIILLSALAEGADRLVARVALEMEVELIAILPMPEAEYLKDFKSESSRKEFHELRGRAVQTHVIPWAGDTTSESVQTNKDHRDRQYLMMGRFVVEHCQALIALWDGVDNGLVGGTASIVNLQLQGNTEINMQVSSSVIPILTGPVYHVLTRRMKNPTITVTDKNYLRFKNPDSEIQSTACKYNVLYPESFIGVTLKNEFDRMFACIENFNRFICENNDGITAKLQQSKEQLIREADCPKDSYLQSLRTLFALSDFLAVKCQSRSHKTLKTIASSLPLIIFFQGVFTNVNASLLIAAVYLLLVIVVYGIYLQSLRLGDQKNYLDCRALAEAMRVQFFWKLAGINYPNSVAQHLLSREQSEMDWIRCAIITWDLYYGGMSYKHSPSHTDIKFINEKWVEGQRDYFKGKCISEHNKHLKFELISKIIFYLAMFLILPVMILIHGFSWGWQLLDQWVMVALPVVVVISAAIGFYSERRLYEFHARQYHRMATLFSKGSDALARSQHELAAKCQNELAEYQKELAKCRKIILWLGREALVENSDWLLMHRERPIDVPKG